MEAGTEIRLVPFDRRFNPAVREWLLEDETRDLVGTLHAPSDAQHDRWYETLMADPKRHARIIVDGGGRPLGIVGLLDIDLVYRRAEIWISVGDNNARRHGAGRRAVFELLTFAFDTLGLHRVHARVFGFNTAARAFFAACGFTEEGIERDGVFKRGRFFPVYVFSLLASEIVRSEPP